MKNINFMSKNKILLIVLAAILVVGVVMLSVFGFNRAYDVGTGYEVDVKVSESLGNSGDKMADAAEAYFKENGLKFTDKAVIGNGEEIAYIFNSKVPDELLPELILRVKAAVPESLATTVEATSNETVAKYNMSEVWYTFLIVGCAAIVACVYIGIRYKIAAALTALCAFVSEVLAFILFIAAVRIPVTANFLTVVTIGAIVALAMAVAFAAQAKNILKADENTAYKTVSETIIRKNMPAAIALTGITLVIFAAFMIFGGALLRYLALQILAAAVILAIFYVAVIPALWEIFKTCADKLISKRKKGYKPAVAVEKNTENTAQ